MAILATFATTAKTRAFVLTAVPAASAAIVANMNDRWTHKDVANYQAKRGLKIEIVDEQKVKIHREVKHDYKAEFEQQLELVGIKVEREFVFAPPRKWRADWRVKNTRILVEFEGGLYAKRAAGHSSVSGIQRDIRKYNAAAIAGWAVIRITPEYVVKGDALKWVEDALRSQKSTATGLSGSPR